MLYLNPMNSVTKRIIQTCSRLCKRQRCYNRANNIASFNTVHIRYMGPSWYAGQTSGLRESLNLLNSLNTVEKSATANLFCEQKAGLNHHIHTAKNVCLAICTINRICCSCCMFGRSDLQSNLQHVLINRQISVTWERIRKLNVSEGSGKLPHELLQGI